MSILASDGIPSLADEQITWTDANADFADDSASDNALRWALADHLGTIREVVNNSGAVVDHIAYNAFGEVTAETNPANSFGGSGVASPTATFFGYTGRLFDTATGLQNNLHRWYDARVGRWLSEDPISFAAGDANLYRYVGNASTIYVDPRGLYDIAIDPGYRAALPGLGAALIGAGAKLGGAAVAATPAVACVAAAGVGYGLGTKIDEAGLNPITPIFVGIVDGWYWMWSRPGNTLPGTGQPGSSASEDRGNGQGTIRDYGADGRACTDFDFGHDHAGTGDPHAHDWDWSQQPPRGPGRSIEPGE